MPSENVKVAIEDIVKRTGGLGVRLVLAYTGSSIESVEQDYAIALASNGLDDGLLDAPPPAETTEKLRAIFGIKPSSAPASWYYADRSAEEYTATSLKQIRFFTFVL